MKQIFNFALQILVVSFLIAMKQASACSVAINDNYEKNLLVAQAASHMNISLAKVTSTTIAEYSRSLLGNIEPFDCPEFLSTQARISFKYKPKKNQNCDASVVVHHQQYMGEVPGTPLYELDFSEMTAACSTSSGPILIPSPHRIPIPVPIPRHDHD